MKKNFLKKLVTGVLAATLGVMSGRRRARRHDSKGHRAAMCMSLYPNPAAAMGGPCIAEPNR